MTSDIPRKARLDQNTKAELTIRTAVHEVEKLGAHRLLTEAVVLLMEAFDKVAEYIDTPEKQS